MLPLKSLVLAALFAVQGAPLLADDCSDDPTVQAMEKAVKADPKNPQYNFNLAGAYTNKQCYDPAVDAYERTVKLVKGDGPDEDSMRFNCYVSLGELYYQARKDFPEAERNFKLALKMQPADKESLNGISLTESKLGKLDEAERYLDAYIAADPADPEARFRRANILNKRLEAEGKEPSADLQRKVVKAYSDAADKAEAADRGAGSGPKPHAEMLLACYARMGVLYSDTNQTDLAVKAFKKAIALAPDDYGSHFLLGGLYFKLQDYADMVDQYQQAVKIDPKQSGARFNLGVAYINQEHFYEAWQQFQAITEIEPTNSEALVLMGQTLQNAAEQLLSEGTAHLTAGELTAAKESFEKVLSLDPKNKAAISYLDKVNAQIDSGFRDFIAEAKLELKKKKKEKAVDTLEKALAIKPDDPEAKKLLGDINADISKLVGQYIKDGQEAYDAQDYARAAEAWKHAANFSEGKESAQKHLAKLATFLDSKLGKALKKAKEDLAHKRLLEARDDYHAAQAFSSSDKITNGLSLVNALIAEKVKKLVDSGKSAYAGGDKDRAKKDFNDALKLDPTNTEANSYISKLTGSESNAKVNAEKVKSLYYQGVDQYVNNHIKEAIATWQELLTLDPNHQDAQKNIARAQAKLKALAGLR